MSNINHITSEDLNKLDAGLSTVAADVWSKHPNNTKNSSMSLREDWWSTHSDEQLERRLRNVSRLRNTRLHNQARTEHLEWLFNELDAELDRRAFAALNLNEAA